MASMQELFETVKVYAASLQEAARATRAEAAAAAGGEHVGEGGAERLNCPAEGHRGQEAEESASSRGGEAEAQAAYLDRLERRREAYAHVRAVLGQLEQLRALLDKNLLKYHLAKSKGKPEKVAAVQRAFTAGLTQWRAHPVVTHALQTFPASTASDEESDQQEDTLALEKLSAAARAPHAAAPDVGKLRAAVGKLRGLERDVEFHTLMLSEVYERADATGYSTENFAYGSTPLSSWLELMEHPRVRPHVADAARNSGTYMVWGSSIGWLALYGALCYGLPTVGYELLGCHVDAAENICVQLAIPGVRLHKEDMLRADLRGTALLFLTSQCWDSELLAAAHAKVASQLQPGAIVLDYRRELASRFGEPIAVVVAPVSWNPHQALYAFLVPEQPANPC